MIIFFNRNTIQKYPLRQAYALALLISLAKSAEFYHPSTIKLLGLTSPQIFYGWTEYSISQDLKQTK